MPFVGPIVGEVTETSARVVVRPDRVGLVSVTLTHPGTAPVVASRQATEDAPVVGLALSGLNPATEYALTVALDGTPVAGRGGRVVTRSPAAEQLGVAAVSCNFTVREGDSSRWQHLLVEQVRPRRVSAVLHIGDQVYMDGAFGQSVHDVKTRGKTDQVRREIAARFRRVYEYAWNYAPTREVLATTSNLMIWDDHEVRNGWGSHASDRDPGSNRHWVGSIARQVFQEFQRQLWADPDPAAPHEAHVHVYGQTAVLFLDQRGGRTVSFDAANPYLGSEQWTWLQGTFESAAFANVRALLVVTSVPLLYVGEAAAAIGGFVASDLRDQWSHPAHVPEQERLVALLAQWKQAVPGREVAVVGGDVHVGGQSVLEVKKPNGEFASLFNQYITSPITNEPPGPLAFFGVKTLLGSGHHVLGDHFRYRHHGLTRRRNYAVLTLEAAGAAARISGVLSEDPND